jgi:hypothetical protein
MTKKKAMRDNVGKPEIDYVCFYPKSLEVFARTMEYGARKYDHLNFLYGGKPDREYTGSLMRHLLDIFKYIATKDKKYLYDEESGCMVVGHIMFNIMSFLDLNHPDLPATREEYDKQQSK